MTTTLTQKDTREDATKIYKIIGANQIAFNGEIGIGNLSFNIECLIRRSRFRLSDNQTRDLIKVLLNIDTKQRIGYKPHTKRYIVTQPYFDDVDFEAVYNKTVAPPRIPLLDQASGYAIAHIAYIL